MMNTFKVSENLLPITEELLQNDNIYYEVEKELGTIRISVALSGMEFREYIENSMCVLQQGSKKTPVITYRTLVNDKRRQRTKRHGSYRILSKDTQKAMRYLALR